MTVSVENVGIETVDAARAQQIINEYPYPKQRKLNRKKVVRWMRIMQDGQWMPSSEMKLARLESENGDSWNLIDGQHRLAAIAECGLSQGFVFTYLKCNTLDEMGILYTNTDRSMTRKLSDAYAVFNLTEVYGLRAEHINRMGSAVKWILKGLGKEKGGVEQPDHIILQAMKDYENETALFFELIAGAEVLERRALKRALIMATALVSLKYSVAEYGQDVVESFWNGIAMNDGLARRDPRRLAHKLLVESIFAGGGQYNTTRKVRSGGFQAHYVIRCFEHHLEHNEIKSIRISDANSPILVPGAPPLIPYSEWPSEVNPVGLPISNEV